MRIVSLNIGKCVEQPWRTGTMTAIHKTAIADKLWLAELGLEGDEQADLKNHGGKDKAILVLPSSAYQRFEISHPYGFLGENLTISDIDEDEICLGDRLQIGSVLLEVTQPRSPCWKLDAQATQDSKWQTGEFLKAYSDSGRVGFYCRVLGQGWLQENQSVRWLTRNEEQEKKFPRISVKTLFLARHNASEKASRKILKEAVKHPALSLAWSQSIQTLLQR
ncbi:MOSC domain-containing protein [Thiomicrorhabdus sp. Kp2]|uniref:MOSC domain-containing protein n=1 Tax=Thiomicrorhabdus sp. Kp2 TaxID=1123518 RepID=UPI000408734E|nr:MOSC domain-containing protein [Thiomicrorhabdus sp. Kp2]